ncbi:MAG: hypothetical protein IJW05_00420 [Lentisphaeria bacterium]|nr:hypothetical protein [Lentisphaeria bacterium]
MFNKKKFKSPDSVNYPGYFWFWNAPLKKKELLSQLEDMHRMGAKSVCPHPLPKSFRAHLMTSMEPEYLTPEYFKLYQAVIEKCSELGMNSYLYDEGGWPSGGACGQVYASNPEAFCRKLYKLDKNGEVVICSEPQSPNRASIPDVLNPAAVEKFLELTHRSYQKRIGKEFGKTVRFTFMDEPELGAIIYGLPWTSGVEEEFLKRKHYDIRPHLKEILQNSDTDTKVIEKRLDYYDVLSQLLVERFLIPVRDYCRKNGLISGGHFGGEDEWFSSWYMPKLQYYGSILRSLRALDAPGVDLIWRQLERSGRHHPFPKLASSAAAQMGNPYVLAEMFGVYGNGICFDEMKFLVDYMLVCGVNTFVFCAYPYSTKGSLMEGERPHFGKVNPLWEYTPELHLRTARLSSAFTGAKPVVKAAVYFDVRSSWVGGRTAEYAMMSQIELSNTLLNTQHDFDYVDDQVLAEGSLKGGKLCFGKASYECLILPPKANLCPEAAENLGKMKRAGFPVFSADQAEEIAPVLKVSPSTRALRVRKMRSGNGEVLYFVLNTSDRFIEAELEAEEKTSVVHCDPSDGNLYSVKSSGNGCWNWRFAPYDSALFLLGKQTGMDPVPESGEAVQELDSSWELSVRKEHFVGEDNYEVREQKESFRKIELENLEQILGTEFSGEVCYRKEFQWDGTGDPAFLDLGKVSFAARVKLNGEDLGTKIFTPFVFPLNGCLKKGNNLLEITVANTLSNAIVPERIRERWLKEFPDVCAYEIRQRDFESESLESGLFGPVLLREKKRTEQ